MPHLTRGAVVVYNGVFAWLLSRRPEYPMPTIADNVQRIQETIAEACARSGRGVDAVTLIAVSKQKPVSMVVEAMAAGVQHFGENRVEECAEKIPAVAAQVATAPTWHFIGHVQSRKAKDIVRRGGSPFGLLHSLDSVKLAEKFSRLCQEHDVTLPALIQCNVSGEASKEGFDAVGWETDDALRATLIATMRQIVALPGLEVQGLMTLAPYTGEAEATRPVFASLRGLRDLLAEAIERPLPHLSMGMTNDYPVAIEEGATLVRVGRAIFGERKR